VTNLLQINLPRVAPKPPLLLRLPEARKNQQPQEVAMQQLRQQVKITNFNFNRL